MKQSLLVAISSAAVGAAAALFFARPEVPVARTTVRAQPMDLAGLEAAFRRALRDVEISAVLRSDPPKDAPTTAPGPIRRGPAVPDRSVAPLPPARIDVLAQVGNFRDDSGFRRTWILRDESEVIDWLGTPDRINTGSGWEQWVYNLPDGPAVCVRFNRGRVVDVFRSG